MRYVLRVRRLRLKDGLRLSEEQKVNIYRLRANSSLTAVLYFHLITPVLSLSGLSSRGGAEAALRHQCQSD